MYKGNNQSSEFTLTNLEWGKNEIFYGAGVTVEVESMDYIGAVNKNCVQVGSGAENVQGGKS